MKANVYPTAAARDAARTSIVDIADWFDGACDVFMVEGNFDPTNPATFPSPSSAFAVKLSGSWAFFFDAPSGRHMLVAEDPAGGWDFTSTAPDVTITGYVIRNNDAPTSLIGANLFPTPIPISAIGQTITLPYVCVDVEDVIAAAQVPCDPV